MNPLLRSRSFSSGVSITPVAIRPAELTSLRPTSHRALSTRNSFLASSAKVAAPAVARIRASGSPP